MLSFQARTAVAMSHFLSNMLENLDVRESFGPISTDNFPNPDLLHGEVISQVMADDKIRGFGIWFDEHKYPEPIGI